MRSLWKHSLVLACSALMLALPLTVFAAQPDTYVSIGPMVNKTFPDRSVSRVDVTVGNAGNVAPNASVYAFLRVSTASGPVCPELGIPDIQGKLSPGAAFKAFRFEVAYAAQVLKTVFYTIEAEVRYLNYQCSQFETNCANNLKRVTYKFSAGGTPSCVKLPQ